MQLWLKRVGNALYPDGDESIVALENLPFDKALKAEITQPRNLQHHKLFFALCARIGKGIGKETEWVEKAFKAELGHVDIFNYGGKPHLALRSIAFHKMDQIAFNSFFNECVQVAYDQWHIDPASIADLLVPEEQQKRA
jgi:hypothetical protein